MGITGNELDDDPFLEPDDVDVDVIVSFVGPDFRLDVQWTTSPTTDDETRANAAAEWFAEVYGFAVIEHVTDIRITEVDDSEDLDDDESDED